MGGFSFFFYHLMNTSALLFLTPLALCGLTLFQNTGTSSQLCIKKLSSGRTAIAVDILSWWFPQHSGWCSFSLNNLQRLLPRRHLDLFGLTCLLLSTGTRQLPDSTDARASLLGTLYTKMSRSFLVSEPRSWFNEHGYKLCQWKAFRPPAQLLGGSGGVVNSLDFCTASVKSLGCFYFRCILSSQWTVVTEYVNFTLPTLKAFLEARSQNVSGNKQ